MDRKLKEALSRAFPKNTAACNTMTRSASLNLGPDEVESLERAVSSGLKLIQWTLPHTLDRLPVKFLWQMSKQGVWNHVEPSDLFRDPAKTHMAKFILDNPNIVHSWGRKPEEKIPQGLRTYDAVQPLPGEPVWSLLPDADALPAYLDQCPKDEFIRMRWDRDKGQLFSLGDALSFHYCQPGELPDGYLDEICRMVDAGGSVDITHVRANLEKAYLIAYAEENGVIVGDSSLKHPRQVFIDRLRHTVGLDFTGFVERGYTSVRPEYRALGVGKKLLQGLTVRAGEYKVFSIIGEDNPATQKIALRNNTRKILTYFSDKTQKEMGIWMPEEMIPKAEAQWGRKL